MLDFCPICSSNEKIEIYHEENVPLFQNKTYVSEKEATNVEKGSINLLFCRRCGFVWNDTFDVEKLTFDSEYHNEQSCSRVFMEHLTSITHIIEKKIQKDSQIVEIGCGKGNLLNLLHNSGYYNLNGFDPTYEGDASFIQKCYYPLNGSQTQADLFIMAHVLEYMPDPLNFLKRVNITNGNKGTIYIETPNFEWIAKNGVFWDISCEKFSYFSLPVLKSILPSCKVDYLFGGQYLYAIGDLKVQTPENNNFDTSKISPFKEKMKLCSNFVHEQESLALWGAGAKGVNFARIIDPSREKIKLRAATPP